MIQGTVVFSGNARQPCLADYIIKLDDSKTIQSMKVLLSENEQSKSTFINNNDFSTYSAVKAVLENCCYGVRFDFIDVYYLHPDFDSYPKNKLPDISKIPLKWKPTIDEFKPLSPIQKLIAAFGGTVTRTAEMSSFDTVVGQNEFFCEEPYYAARDFKASERDEKYAELCRLFDL
ncbi:hypothetical protein J4N45_09870 [Vibrio sp. SCSIO 43140]|uniref:hypothetical protein n=1 Tax=Vibrio sp. SCSIO 43140 TaxID=2819100 RepID=UPI002075D28B|nr:hypothetical protein [Vibrio sp. SCSIO 43140]USD58835.1 hypothetical protein J4N45_09870 [Vibrio sp. SCSIO 43140]